MSTSSAAELRSLQCELHNGIKQATKAATDAVRKAQDVAAVLIYYAEPPDNFHADVKDLCRLIINCGTSLCTQITNRRGLHPAEFPHPLLIDSVLMQAASDQNCMHGVEGKSATHLGYMVAFDVLSSIRDVVPRAPLRADASFDIPPESYPRLHERFRSAWAFTDTQVEKIIYAIQREEVRAISHVSQVLQSATLVLQCPPDVRLTATATPPDLITYLGDGAYQIGDEPPITVGGRADGVLRAFLDQPGHTMGSGQLNEALTGCDANAIVRTLRKLLEGPFGPAIRMAGGKGKGGYHVNIRKAATPKKQTT